MHDEPRKQPSVAKSVLTNAEQVSKGAAQLNKDLERIKVEIDARFAELDAMKAGRERSEPDCLRDIGSPAD